MGISSGTRRPTRSTVKHTLFSIVIIALFFTGLETISRVFIFPGSYDYIERRIIEHNLPQTKKPGEFRIFLYGESTMHGGALYPYSVIGKWLRLYLADLLPEDVMRRVTVVNFGRMGENSDFIATSFAETAAYKPDLAIFYTVHNDFCLTEYRPAALRKKQASFKKKFENFCMALPKKSSFLNLLNRIIIRAKIERNKIRDARLGKEDPWYTESSDPEGYMDDANLLRPGSPELRFITENFEKNVNRIMKTARRHSVHVIFFEGLARWKGYAPVKSIHRSDISRNTLLAWEELFQKVENLFNTAKYNEALALYRECIEMDASYALAYYRAAECYERIGDYARANEYYITANDNDYFPIRAPSLVNRFYEKIRLAGIKNIDVIQTQKIIEANSPNGIVDETLIMDQIHPSPEGQAFMAIEIAKLIYKNNLLAPQDRWQWDKLRNIDELKKTLNLDSERMFHIYINTANYMGKHYSEAAKFLEKALTIKPKSIFARSWLAWTYWKMGRLNRAMILYRELYREKPSLASDFFKKHPDIEELL